MAVHNVKVEGIEKLEGKSLSVNPKQTGWKRTVSFSRWEKYGQARLYINYVDYDRKGLRRNHGQEAGYIDLVGGEVVGPLGTVNLVREALSKI